MNRNEAGLIGGLQTYLRHGSKHMSEIGKQGGRPRLPTLTELRRQQSASSDPLRLRSPRKNEKEERLTNSLRGLKTLYLQRNGTGGGLGLPRGGLDGI